MSEIKLQFSVDDIEVNGIMNDEEYKHLKEIGLEPIRYLIARMCQTVYDDERFKDKGIYLN